MQSYLRMLLVAAALLSSGVLQAAAIVGGDACCEQEKGATWPDCPLGVACSCCPFRGAVQVSAPATPPASSPGKSVAMAFAEPSLRASVADIFHPPRA